MITTRRCSGMLCSGRARHSWRSTLAIACWAQLLSVLSVIDKVCSEARFLHTVADLNSLGLRLELRNRFFDVVTDVLSDAPCAQEKSSCVIISVCLVYCHCIINNYPNYKTVIWLQYTGGHNSELQITKLHPSVSWSSSSSRSDVRLGDNPNSCHDYCLRITMVITIIVHQKAGIILQFTDNDKNKRHIRACFVLEKRAY